MAGVVDLVSFDATNGLDPEGSLISDSAGNLYGTTVQGGADDEGTVFEIARNATTGAYASTPTTLVSFNSPGTGVGPNGSLIADASGNLYGTTTGGGTDGDGTVFEIARNATTGAYASTPTTLVSFNGFGSGSNGAAPRGSLIADASGNLYGTTTGGGANDDGTVFEITRNATTGSYATTPTTVVSFNGAGNGAKPFGSLIADASGNLYGTTASGSASNDGTVFEIARNATTGAYASTPTTLVSFNGSGTEGAIPYGSLIADASGNLYGTTSGGGSAGTVFEIARNATTGAYASTPTTLVSFSGIGYGTGTNGANPFGSLLADASGNLYGTTLSGGANNDGTVFEIARNATTGAYASTPTTLVTFDGAGNGAKPYGSLIADASGNLYGTTSAGGANNDGTVFEVTAPVCFAQGTRIRVLRDGAIQDIAVEHLVVGDLAVTASGALRDIRWLGHRATEYRRHPEPALVQPVRIAAHAFGPSLPARDLVVSPGHALCLEAMGEVLVPASALIDGRAVVQLDVERVTYWHVELDSHDILLADNLPAESYLEMGNRGFFAEARAVALHGRPDARVTRASVCRPFVDRGPRLAAVRARLAAVRARLAPIRTTADASRGAA